jgi:hypothetical protein
MHKQSNRDREALNARNTVHDWSSCYGASKKAFPLWFSVTKTNTEEEEVRMS